MEISYSPHFLAQSRLAARRAVITASSSKLTVRNQAGKLPHKRIRNPSSGIALMPRKQPSVPQQEQHCCQKLLDVHGDNRTTTDKMKFRRPKEDGKLCSNV